MLSEAILKATVPAICALLGAVGGLAIGYFKWRHERRDSRAEGFFSDRKSAYKRLIEKTEEVNLLLRSQGIEKKDLDDLLFNVNAHLLTCALYIDEEDRVLANHYLRALYELNSLIDVAVAHDVPGSAEVQEGWEATMILEMPKDLYLLRKKQEYATSLRQELIDRSRTVAKGLEE